MFSKACEYAIKALAFIAKESKNEKRSNLKAIAKEIGSPEAFTAKVLQQLTKQQIIQSVAGAYGGFEMDEKKAKNTKLKTIVMIIDGESIFKACGLGLENCSEKHPCILHEEYKPIRNQIEEMLNNTSIFDLSNKTSIGKAFLKQ